MKYINKLQPLMVPIIASALVSLAAAEKPVTPDVSAKVSEKIPKSVHFGLKDIKGGKYSLVGSLSVKRKFLGMRSDPAYQDLVQFHCFNGDELKFASFSDPKVEALLLKSLSSGHSIPAMMTVQFESISVGRDGINTSKRLKADIEDCKLTTADAVCAAAEAAKLEATSVADFKAGLAPDAEKDGVAVSLGNVSVRSKVTPRSIGLGIHGVKVFNTTSKPVSIEILKVSMEQDGVLQECVMNKRSKAALKWQVEATSWSDGIYSKGEMPQNLWMFDYAKPIKPGKKVKVQFEIKLNDGDTMILSRTVDPV